MKARFLKIGWKENKLQSCARLNGFKWNQTMKLWVHPSEEGVEIAAHSVLFPCITDGQSTSVIVNNDNGRMVKVDQVLRMRVYSTGNYTNDVLSGYFQEG